MSTPIQIDVRSTPTTLAPAVGALVAPANSYRSYLAIQVTGQNPASFGFGSIPAAGAGITLDGGTAAETQGGTWEWVLAVPTDAIYGFSTAGTTVVVIEGINQGGGA